MKRFFLILPLFFLLLTACSQGDASFPDINVLDAWTRPSPLEKTKSGFFVRVVNNSDSPDTLVSAEIGACEKVEIHNVTHDEDGNNVMAQVESVTLPIDAGAAMNFKPGSYHLMCFGKTEAFSLGQTMDLTLNFEKAGQVKATVQVREGGGM